MKNLLFVLLIIISILLACTGFRTNENKNNGGILIIYGDTSSTTSLVLLENDIKILPQNKRYVHIEPLEPGTYSLLIDTGIKKMANRIVNNIIVKADSLSIFPLSYFKWQDKVDTLNWSKKKHWNRGRKLTNNGMTISMTSIAKDGKITVIDSVFSHPLPKRIHKNEVFPTSKLSGKIFSYDKPLKNVLVTISNWWSTETNENGFYQFDSILPGIYDVHTGGLINRIHYKGQSNYYVEFLSDSTIIKNFHLEPNDGGGIE
ncbi:MAG: hypothetical protein COW71_06720 [Ignavibacteriales bacterium CG18_big_fil_WC_8_21_14_2_50_31_20]|nr:MAG: hypothetical protein COW71_06720 [Ignavibacteriales bacterium CG18_big_fil_WC_8_21_14_2_50_31_20]